MKIFLIDIRNESNEEEYKMCSDILIDYFKKHHIDVFVLRENTFSSHPSWLKLKCFDYVTDDSFVLCWDMDLLPRRNCPSICSFLKFDKINLVVDSSLILKNHPSFIREFRYNCGLMGIPRSYQPMMESIFQERKDSNWPCYEQFHINEVLARNDFSDVHELDKSWNCFFHLPTIPNHYMSNSHLIHYTGIYMTDSIRKRLIKNHHSTYFK